MISKNDLCQQIRKIYPDIGACGIDLDVDYDKNENRWTVILRKYDKELKTFLEPGDAESCLAGKQCLSLAIEINQLKDNVDRMPDIAVDKKSHADVKPAVCEKAPEFAEHYRMGDDDLPCDDGRTGHD